MLRRLSLFATLAFTAPAPAAEASASPVPAAAPLSAEELFRWSALGQARLSPDGRYLAGIRTDERDLRHLVVIDLMNHHVSGLQAAGGFEVSAFNWVGNDRLLFNIAKERFTSWGLYTATVGHLDDYYPIDDTDPLTIVGVPRSRPGHVLIWVNPGGDSRFAPSRLLEFDATLRPDPSVPATQGNTVVRSYQTPAKGRIVRWMVDRDGEPALCVMSTGGGLHLFRYQAAADSWREVALNLQATFPLGLDPDNRFFWLEVPGESGGSELHRCDLETGDLGPALLTDPTYSFASGRLYFSDRSGALIGISYVQRKRSTVWLRDDYREVQRLVDEKYPATQNVLMDHDRADRRFVFHVTGAQQPGLFVLLDLDTQSLEVVAQSAPWLDHRSLLPVQPVSFRTRDHVKLEGYLTLPPGASEQHPVPMVVLVHGGPWARDTFDFSPEVQFLASRGYAVLQPNYRGSSGYDPALNRFHEFDFRRMGDDVTDATRAMLRGGRIDPKRVAIMGASFGGYLALAGVTFENNLYCCAVAACGVFDWQRLVRSRLDNARPGEREMLQAGLGEPGRDQAHFDAISPLAHADQIHVPVLIAHGVDDRIVDIAQSRALADALTQRGVPHETFFRKLEGHSFYKYQDRVDYYHRVEAFLAAQLGGQSLAPAPAPDARKR
ncbi:MAG TPA: S9 family peptidase [Opitutus sp.]|nr:S9 family peptidase [Opitutus sp.]